MPLRPTLKRLVDIIRDARRSTTDGWLFLPKDDQWTVNTCGIIINVDLLDDSDVTDDEMPLFAEQNDLIDTIDSGTLEFIYMGAARLEDPPSDQTLLEAFMYYYRFDAYLPEVGAPDPPAPEVAIRNLDRQFYDSLGAENSNRECKRQGCDRGTVKLSAFCRVHHFENVKQKPWPFDD